MQLQEQVEKSMQDVASMSGGGYELAWQLGKKT